MTDRLIERKIVYFDHFSGETLVVPAIGTYMPNLIRGPYVDEDGKSFHIMMVQIHPAPVVPDDGKELPGTEGK